VKTGTEPMFKRDAEVRVTDTKTGGQKGSKLPQLGAIEAQAILELARVAGMGAEKYSRHNFLKGFAWSLSSDALDRHLLWWKSGEDLDSESGLHHLAHAAWHCLALISFHIHGLGTDDRWKAPSALDALDRELAEATEAIARGDFKFTPVDFDTPPNCK
jgi:hypothetical protein